MSRAEQIVAEVRAHITPERAMWLRHFAGLFQRLALVSAAEQAALDKANRADRRKAAAHRRKAKD